MTAHLLNFPSAARCPRPRFKLRWCPARSSTRRMVRYLEMTLTARLADVPPKERRKLVEVLHRGQPLTVNLGGDAPIRDRGRSKNRTERGKKATMRLREGRGVAGRAIERASDRLRRFAGHSGFGLTHRHGAQAEGQLHALLLARGSRRGRSTGLAKCASCSASVRPHCANSARNWPSIRRVKNADAKYSRFVSGRLPSPNCSCGAGGMAG